MGQELGLTTMLGSEVGLKQLYTLLSAFEKEHHVRVHVRILDLRSAWKELLQAAIHGQGADCSEISISWLMDMAEMNALAPMPQAMQARMNTSMNYLRGCLGSASIPNDPRLWAVPWLAGLRVIYYRHDLLARAGLHPAEVFSSAKTLAEALGQLKAAGIERPWIVNTHHSLSTVHNITSWIWGAGGDIYDHHKQQLVFAEPAALNGAADYFELAQFLGPDPGALTDERVIDLFFNGHAAMTIDGHWNWLSRRYTSPDIARNIQLALSPGVPFISGSNLVVWKHSRQPTLAWELAAHLSGPSSSILFSAETNLLPTRRDLLQISGLDLFPEYEMMARGMEDGRTWPHQPLGGMIENRLQDAYALVWQEVLANRHLLSRSLILDILKVNLEPVQQRLQAAVDAQQSGL